MEFIDHTGHIFSLPDYSEYPIGYEYSENPYVFWFSDEYNSHLSVNCFYVKPIYVVVNANKISKIHVETSQTNNFKLLSSKKIQEQLYNNGMYSEDNNINWSKANFELVFFTDEAKEIISKYPENIHDNFVENDNDDFSNSLDISIEECVNVINESYYFINEGGKPIDIYDETKIYDQWVYANYDGKLITKDEFEILSQQDNLETFKRRQISKRTTDYVMIPFYVLANVDSAGAWMTNLLIHVIADNTNKYCPITVGGTFIDEQEELVVNGKNMGISLPKDICRALYNSSFWNEVPNMSLWNQKIKEYLLNYMKLRSERGNFSSAIQALKWFGYGDKITLSSLIQTDNQVIKQYICDNFDINFDIINEFKTFRYSTLLSLSIPGVVESPKGEINEFRWEDEFWGEGKPKLHDRFSEYIEPKHYDEGDIDWLRPYYDWTFNEIGLKLCALKYYYKKYFLPIHLSIHRASITNQCFASDIKMLNIASNLITEETFFDKDNDFYVTMPDSNVLWLEDMTGKNIVIHPESWICDSHIKVNELEETFYLIEDNCFIGNIDFTIKNFEEGDDHVFYCNMFIYQDERLLNKSNFVIYSTEEKYSIKFVILPSMLNASYDLNWWLDKNYTVKLCVNGLWYTYKFTLAIPELDIEVGKLEYVYDYDIAKQFSGWKDNAPKFNSYMYLPDAIEISNINFINDLCDYLDNNNLTTLDNKKIVDGDLYYYTFNDKGEKQILCTGLKTLLLKDNKWHLIDNPNAIEGNVETIESDKPIYSSICKNVTSLINLYESNINIPKNLHLMNKIHIFTLFKKKIVNGKYEYVKVPYNTDIYASNKEVVKNVKIYNYHRGYDSTWQEKYGIPSEQLEITYEDKFFGDNDSTQVKDLYSCIFDETGNWTCRLEYLQKDNNDIRWVENDSIKRLFDIYLMHDFDYWYVIMISKSTIGNTKENIDLDTNKSMWKSVDNDNNELYFEYVRSDEKFLINRMNFSKMNGVYHFNTTDTIVARLNNFNNIQNKLKIGSRWVFTPINIGTSFEKSFESKTNIGIMSIDSVNRETPQGYYKIAVRYSIDNFSNEYQARTTKILIDNSIESISYPETPRFSINKPIEKPNEDITIPPSENKSYEVKCFIVVNDDYDNAIPMSCEDNNFSISLDSTSDKLCLWIAAIKDDNDSPYYVHWLCNKEPVNHIGEYYLDKNRCRIELNKTNKNINNEIIVDSTGTYVKYSQLIRVWCNKNSTDYTDCSVNIQIKES